ncbi:MAG: ABC transporter permease [Halobacteriaceae archaeon]
MTDEVRAEGAGPPGTGTGRSAGPDVTGDTSTADDRGDPTDEDLPLGLTLLAAAVAAVVVAPLGWLVLTALRIDPASAVDTLTRPETLRVVRNSLLAVGLVTAAAIALGVPLAYLTVRTDLPFARFWTVALSLPLVIPSYIGAFAFVSAFGPSGQLQAVLAPLGVRRLPSLYGLDGTVLVLTLYTYPYVYLSARSALLTVDERLVDAARTLDHGRLAAFRRVVVPHLRPAVTAGSLLVALYALADFGTPAIMRYDVFTRVIYVNRFELDFAALLSLQLVAAAAVILALESRVGGRRGSVTASRRSNPLSLGRWRWPATLLPAAVAGTALLVPVAILLTWLVRDGFAGNAVGFGPGTVLNSVGVAGATAVVAAAACLPVAVLAARHDGPVVESLFRATYVGYAVPGVALGFALIYLGTRYLTPLYQTLPLLVFAYVVRFLPQAVGSTRAAVLGVDPDLPAAARTLGRSPVGAFRAVTLPLIAPGVLAGGALVFLSTMKELPVTLLVRPTGFDTLVTAIWSAERAGYFGAAAVPALVLLVVSGLSMAVLFVGDGGGRW